ncbi:DUF1173 family protein [Roseateles violae]|uniref:DUF1173 family protein n=1 Tax=Roseateles violae TaxID=3058042 RepID=A0ABT8DNU6_9BURK|nr:DUF1173 family protein [Pelomonas sp. PFR6]MDN3920037.1 DUF1173 family protein [Pelomonas sp. PFR6]
MGDALVTLGDLQILAADLKARPEDLEPHRRAYALRFARDALRVRDRGEHAICHCTDGPGLQLVSKLSSTGKPFLARRAGDQHRHAPDCSFAVSSHANQFGRTSARQKTDTGTDFQAAIDADVSDGLDGEARRRRPPWGHFGARQQNRLTQVGLVEQLLELAEFTTYRGERPSNGLVMGRLRELAQVCKVNGDSMNARVHFSVEDDDPEIWESRKRQAQDGRKGKRYPLLLLVGQVDEIESDKQTGKIHVLGVSDPIQLSPAIIESLSTSFRRPWLSLCARSRREKTVLLFVAQLWVSDSGMIGVHKAALMMLSATWIPADSGHEVRFMNHLVRSGRYFQRPIRCKQDERYEPDVELLDVGQRCLIEIWGLKNKRYLRKKRLKRHYWRKVMKLPLIEWDAASRQPIPELPPAKPR